MGLIRRFGLIRFVTNPTKRWWLAGGVLLLCAAGGVLYWRVVAGTRASETSDAAFLRTATGNPHEAELKNRDGSWKYTNHLVGESSPYLQLHAHNPVEWYPWGPEALERAKRENKPIFLSIGYSTCYWCHVMERLVFSNPKIAASMNCWFVNIKVDREERPEVDEIYMMATQLMTGSGGWPNSVFLTPDLKPFYAGTYFPPADMLGRPGFPKVLDVLQNAWADKRTEVEASAEQVTAAIRQLQSGKLANAPTEFPPNVAETAIQNLRRSYDAQEGGFGSAPKFPPSMNLELLMAEYERTRDASLLRMVTRTLEGMERGGMRDHLGGGFHRYSTDARWRIPHFEKMLYDQALIVKAYLHAYQLTKREDFRRTAEEIFRFVDETMTDSTGGFYSALDSETDGVEGEYYLWTERQIRSLLGKNADLFLKVYGLEYMPTGEGGVLYLRQTPKEASANAGMPEEELRAAIEPLKRTLLQARGQRKLPLLDTKILTAWNGLMIDAYAYGYEVLKDESYLTKARRALEFVWSRLRTKDGVLMRVYNAGKVKNSSYQEDYAFLAQSLLGLYQNTKDKNYLDRATALTDQMLTRFWDAKDGGFFFTVKAQNLIVHTKNPQDSAIPSGNSMAAHALLTLAAETGDTEYRAKARRTMEAFAGMLQRAPAAFTFMILAVHRDLARVGNDASGRSSTTDR